MFAELLNYTTKADAIVIAALHKTDLPEADRLFSHVLTAQHIWAKRILGQQPEKGVWEEQPKTAFEALSAENAKLFDTILSTRQLDELIHYANAHGEFENNLQDILFHVVNHSTYHRAQIATMLKKAGQTPPATDFVILKRTNQL
ncbi:DinB family protein [Pedobacter sp. KR3-3]|uniref:DinB family protein n=1 Tax=Pedobacter albus TaxID=3113905 RepID=A0ABU7ICU9_9SPHI|nr:DinB family protein [Pedobacter sp. KR3-3]MEE1947164.1 DinB family protein [Pedobacter sp. KR3-3]